MVLICPDADGRKPDVKMLSPGFKKRWPDVGKRCPETKKGTFWQYGYF
jgi:hypothetical protein